jgi:hypothetical protein
VRFEVVLGPGAATALKKMSVPDGRIAFTSTTDVVRRIVEIGTDGKETAVVEQPAQALFLS